MLTVEPLWLVLLKSEQEVTRFNFDALYFNETDSVFDPINDYMKAVS